MGRTTETRHGYSTCMKMCQHCGSDVNSKGIGSHERACKRRKENEGDGEAQRNAARAIAVAKAINLRNIIMAKSKPLEAIDTNHISDDIPMDVDDGSLTFVVESNNGILPTAGAHNNAPVDSTGKAIPEAIKIEHHPSSGRPTEIISLHDYHQNTKEPKPPADKDPWVSFNSRGDYEYAEIALEAGLTAKQNNALIALIHRIAIGEARLTLKNNSDLDKAWERASTKLTGFETRKFKVPYKKEAREFEVHFRPVWDWARNILSDARLVSNMVWDAQRIYQYDDKTDTYMRQYDEPWTGDRFWKIQSAIPSNGKPLCFIFYADKNKLSSFGTQKGYPVVMRCANLPISIRNGEGLGGGIIVGWLPIIPEDAGDNGKTTFVNFKNDVWHRAVKIILESIKAHSKTGCWIRCADGENRCIYPCILIISADYEEQCYIALTRGSKCLKPCPVCCVPKEGLNNLTVNYLLRTAVDSKLHYNAALLMSTKKEKQESLKPHGLRLVYNAFWDLHNSDVHYAISWDRLHAYHSGLFAGHLLPVFKDLVIKAQGRSLEAMVDSRIRDFPIWRNLYHFDSVMRVTFNDGKKHEDLSKQLFFVVHDFFNRKDNAAGFVFLRLYRCFLVLDIYFSLELHTSKTIEYGRRELERFGHLLDIFVTSDEDSTKNWKFIKAHSHKHAFDDIEAKGVTRNYNTKPNEKLHGPLRDIYHERTNFRDVAPQILKINHQLLVSRFIRSQLDALEGSNDDESEVEDESEVAYKPKKNGFLLPPHDKYHLGANQPPVTLSHLANTCRSDLAFHDFKRRLTDFLNNLFNLYKIPLPGNKYLKLSPDHLITEFRFLKITYDSLVTRRPEINYLRCSPQFFKKPRYDFVVVDTVKGNIFARLLFLFAIWIDEKPYPIALIQPFDAHLGPIRRTDEDLGLYRVGMKPREKSEFISVLSIIRGAVLVPNFRVGRENEYLVMDVLDGDMFFRVRRLWELRNLNR